MKKCFKCGIEKELNEFYKHPQSLDGHVNKCKECNKKDVRNHYREKIKDSNFVDKERCRNREKYYRLNYKEKYKEKSLSCINTSRYKNSRRNLSKKIEILNTEEFHHWNYNLLDDVIVLDKKLHCRLHKNMTLDKSTGLFYTSSGDLLKTKKDHLDFIEQINLMEF